MLSLSASDFNKITKYTNWLGKVGKVANVAEKVGYVGNMLSAWIDGDTKGVTDELANWISNSACGFISGQIAGALISAFAVTNPLVAFATFAVLGLIGSAIGDEVAEGWKLAYPTTSFLMFALRCAVSSSAGMVAKCSGASAMMASTNESNSLLYATES